MVQRALCLLLDTPVADWFAPSALLIEEINLGNPTTTIDHMVKRLLCDCSLCTEKDYNSYCKSDSLISVPFRLTSKKSKQSNSPAKIQKYILTWNLGIAQN